MKKKDLKKGDIAVEKALLKSATGYMEKVKKAFKLKDVYYDENGKKNEKEKVEIIEEEQYIPPNLSAQTFWLKARCPDIWDKEQKKDDEGFSGGIVIIPEQRRDEDV